MESADDEPETQNHPKGKESEEPLLAAYRTTSSLLQRSSVPYKI